MKNLKAKIIQINSSSQIGGGSQVMWDIVNGLKDFFQFVIVAPKGPFLKKYQKAKIKVYPLSIASYHPFISLKIKKILKKEKPHLIHTHGKGAGVWGRIAAIGTNIPLIHTPHGLHYRQYNKFFRSFYFLLERWLSRKTKKIINVSQSEKKEALELKLYPSEKSIVIFNGIEINFSLKSKNLAFENTLINIGRFNPQKNQRELIEIMRWLPENVTLKIVGEGKERKKIENLIKKYSLEKRIKLLGPLSRKEALNYLIKSKIYLSSSLWEGLPLTLLEAGILGIPIVATKVTGNVDIVEDGQTGFLYQPGNLREAVEKIEKLLKNPHLYQKISENLKLKIKEKFSLNEMLQKYKNLYQSMI